MSREAAALEIARIIEVHMTESGWSEEQKNKATDEFAAEVDAIVKRRRAAERAKPQAPSRIAAARA